MRMSPPKERKRRFHRRSKNGCQTCKGRHVRCDERRPLCTYCLQAGTECEYPLTRESRAEQDLVIRRASGEGHAGSKPSSFGPNVLSDCYLGSYIGGPFDDLTDGSKWLIKHFSRHALIGQQAVTREVDSVVLHRALEDPGYMHVCLMLAACQWAWATGSMDQVKFIFLSNKAAAYRYVRESLQRGETGTGHGIVSVVSALALAEGAVGDLEASSQHLRGIQAALTSKQGAQNNGESLPRQMLGMIGRALQSGQVGKLVAWPDYQPTLMALLFSSIWDVSALPPREAPRYGWWEESDTQAARLWQSHTRDTNINYEISRGFDPTEYIPQMLNGDPRSSRTSFIATFFYLCAGLGPHDWDAVLVDWLLEQLTEDVDIGLQNVQSGTLSPGIWLWCLLFGACVARSGRANGHLESRQLEHWVKTYDDKIKQATAVLDIASWDSAKTVLGELVLEMDAGVESSLENIWCKAAISGADGRRSVNAETDIGP